MWAARLIIVWLCWETTRTTVLAQTPAVPLTPSTAVRVEPSAAVPPLPESPIRYFRQLLALSPDALEKTLAGRTEAQRTVLKVKLREYAEMSDEDRETRLRATELRWYLRPMMELPPPSRVQWQAAVPPDLAGLVSERLSQWDALTPEMRKDVLENDWIAQYFLRYESSTASQREALLQQSPPERRARVEKEMARWQSLSAEERQRMCSRFQQFFELPVREKQRTLSRLSDTERQQMEKTLEAFAQLPPVQRRLCIDSFTRFAGMTPTERVQFLKNAERWKEMTSGERQKWRALVAQLPPLPPGLGQPPMPPALRNPASAGALPPGLVNLTNATP